MTDRTALITGASGGLGCAVSARLAGAGPREALPIEAEVSTFEGSRRHRSRELRHRRPRGRCRPVQHAGQGAEDCGPVIHVIDTVLIPN